VAYIWKDKKDKNRGVKVSKSEGLMGQIGDIIMDKKM
jgi:hypothetical protein